MTAATIAAPTGPPYTVTDGVVVLNVGPPPAIRSRALRGRSVRASRHRRAAAGTAPRLGCCRPLELPDPLRRNPRPGSRVAPRLTRCAPAHALRRGDQLVLAFDTIGGRCCPTRSKNEARPVVHRWTYRLHRFRWASNPELCPGVVAAIRGGR